MQFDEKDLMSSYPKKNGTVTKIYKVGNQIYFVNSGKILFTNHVDNIPDMLEDLNVGS